MIRGLRSCLRSLTLTPVLLACLSLGFECATQAQAPRPAPAAKAHTANPARAESRTIPALLVSDIHFDPFHDPARVRELVAAPVAQWQSILSAPPSSNQPQAFASLQQSCHARGVDTPFALLHSSLQAMKARQPDAKFMAVSGDLMAHAFTCRYSTLFPGSALADYQAFVLKTLSFVVAELRATFPGMPIYAGLGNNDSGCGDYQLDAGSDFLSQAGRIIAEGLPKSQQQEAIKEFGDGGYYSITMAEPMHDTRLIVVNDLFFSPRYSTCAGKPDSAPATQQLSWLEQQLAQARKSGQRVWVVGHIPPGIDPYSTMSRFRDVCGGQSPVMFLSSDKMADLMVEYADVMRLGIFGHTHMDEVRLLESEGAEPQNAEVHLAAIKVVPSISPVDGNNPSFTVARVNPSSAMLENFEVIAASNQTGIAASWAKEYDYAQTFHQTQFSPLTVKKMIDGFSIDHGANTPASEAYLRHYFVGDRTALLSPFWPQYVCALDNHTAKGYAACVCSTTK
jgi:sphingomyelin phosphodiesterase acid-like 3